MSTTNITGNNNQSGGQTVTPLNWGMFNRQAFDGNVRGMEVTQTGTPSLAVSVAAGIALLDYNTVSSTQGTTLTAKALAIDTASTSNPRIDAVIVYEDTSVSMATSEPFTTDANNGRFKLRGIVGTPGAVPVAPTDGVVQSTIGSGKPWARLANVTVPKSATNIINSNIADTRSLLSSKLADGAVTSPNIDFSTFTSGNGFPIVSANTSNSNVNSDLWYLQYTTTISSTGVYLILFSQRMTSGTTGNDFSVSVHVNGTLATNQSSGGSSYVNYVQATTFHAALLTSGDVVTLRSRGGGAGGSYTTAQGRAVIVRLY